MNDSVTVLKRNLQGEVTWRYPGRVLRREGNSVVLEAYFNRADTPFMGILLKEHDRFVETFYSDRWYNIFEIYDRDDGSFKGQYCNIARPADLADGSVAYVDLALDLWIAADGTQTVLDLEEFESLPLDPESARRARQALDEIQAFFTNRKPPARPEGL